MCRKAARDILVQEVQAHIKDQDTTIIEDLLRDCPLAEIVHDLQEPLPQLGDTDHPIPHAHDWTVVRWGTHTAGEAKEHIKTYRSGLRLEVEVPFAERQNTRVKNQIIESIDKDDGRLVAYLKKDIEKLRTNDKQEREHLEKAIDIIVKIRKELGDCEEIGKGGQQ